MNVSFIGLGVMGFHMAGYLSKAGHNVCVYNRSQDKVTKWLEKFQGTSANSAQQAVKNADFVMTCVKDDASLRELLLGADGVIAHMKQGSMLIDHTTASAIIARELAAVCGENKISFLDAPITGGEAGAVNGQLSIMVGGNTDDFARAKPVMDVYAKNIEHMGEHGNGQLTKMVNQICMTGLIQALAEGISFAEHAGLDVEKAMAVVSQGSAASWQQQNRHMTMIKREFNFGFAVDLIRKDLDMAITEAYNNGTSLPVTALVHQFLADVQKAGGGRFDASSLITRLP